MRVTLVSTYDLGRQPFGIASAAAWLREAGHDVRCVDTSRTPLQAEAVEGAAVVAFHLPMHTATRLAVPLLRRVRAQDSTACLVTYGLYAPLNAHLLRTAGADVVLGVECEQDLVDVAARVAAGGISQATGGGVPVGERGDAAVPSHEGSRARTRLPHLALRVPDRTRLPPLHRYAHLRLPDGQRRVTGYTEASRGCRHSCRHCPVVPVYRGQFRLVPIDVVLADIAQQVEQGATHITFGDPDFLNGPRHAVAVAEALAARFDGLTFDVTVKVEHLVTHARLLPALQRAGCALVTSAIESFDDEVLTRLRKGHTGAEAEQAVAACRAAGLTLAPTFVAFTPWTTLTGYVAFLQRLVALDLIEHVAPIQLALRLLIPEGSLLLDDADLVRLVRPFDEGGLVYPWSHTDPAVDALQRDVEALVAARTTAPRAAVFAEVMKLAASYAPDGDTVPPADLPARASVPYLEEPWYC
jgi:radical SAM superfamily enzyme YgiQ (UPF0313 family)